MNGQMVRWTWAFRLVNQGSQSSGLVRMTLAADFVVAMVAIKGKSNK
jgi:hypothetical protein